MPSLHVFVKPTLNEIPLGAWRVDRKGSKGEMEKQAKGYCGCEIQFPAADTQRIKSERREKFGSREISKYYSRVTRGKPFRILLAPCRRLRGSRVVSYCLASICLLYRAKCTSALVSLVTFRCNHEKCGLSRECVCFASRLGGIREWFSYSNTASKRQARKGRCSPRSYMHVRFADLEEDLKEFLVKNPPLFCKTFISVPLRVRWEKYSLLVNGIQNTETDV